VAVSRLAYIDAAPFFLLFIYLIIYLFMFCFYHYEVISCVFVFSDPQAFDRYDSITEGLPIIPTVE